MTLFPLIDINGISPVKTRLYRLGLPAFVYDIHGADLTSYIAERLDVLCSQISNVSEDDSLNSASFISRVRGAATDADSIPILKSNFNTLLIKSCDVEMSCSIIDQVGSLVNMHSYSNQRIPDIFIPDFYSIQMEGLGKRRKLSVSRGNILRVYNIRDRLILSNNAIDSLRLRCSKITMLPFIFQGSFMIAVLLVRKAKAYVLSCKNETDPLANIAIKEVVLKMIEYRKDGNTNADAWVIYVDGEDVTKPSLFKEPLLSKSCAVYCCCYMMYIGFHSDIDEVVVLFENKEYASLFLEVNSNNIIRFKQIIAVLIADAEMFLHTTYI